MPKQKTKWIDSESSNAERILKSDGSGGVSFSGAFTQGASFPGSPITGDLHYDTDDEKLYSYVDPPGAWLQTTGSGSTGITSIDDNGTDIAMTIDSSQRIGIGEATPGSALHITTPDELVVRINSTTTGKGRVAFFNGANVRGSMGVLGSVITGGSDVGIGISSEDVLAFGSGGTEAMRIDSSQRVLIGDSVLNGANADSSLVVAPLGGTGAARITIRGLTNNSSTIDFADTADNNPGQISYNHASNAMIFRSGDTETMRIDSSQNLLIGATSATDVTSGSVDGLYIDDGGTVHSAENSTASFAHYNFYNPNGAVGNILTNGSATAFNTSSDPRLKTAFSTLSETDLNAAFINILSNTGKFEFLANPGKAVVGFNAHGLLDIAGLGSEIGSEGKGPRSGTLGSEYDTGQVDGNGDPVMERITPAGVDQSKVVPYLVLKIKQLETKNSSLESRIAALEAV